MVRLATVVAIPVTCEDCGGTGRCATCGGTGELSSGEVCYECVGGLSMVCVGSGQDLRFEVDGRPIRWSTRRWKMWIESSLVAVGLAAVAASAQALGYVENPDAIWLLTLAAFAAGGGVALVFALYLWGLQRQMDRLSDTFYARAYENVDTALDAFLERRRRCGLE